MKAYAHEFLQCEVTIGSKQYIMNQCVYFAFRNIVLFGVIFPKKHVFLKRNFQMKCFEILYILYL